MSTFTFASVAGSPGATTLALGVAAVWAGEHHRRAVVEADPDGGRLGTDLGIGTEPGLMALAVAARSGSLGADEIVAEGGARIGDWWLVPGPPSAEHTHAALAQAAPSLARTLAREREWTWIVDAGRLSARSPALPFGTAADLVVVATDGSLAALQLLPTRVDALVNAGCAVGLVVVGDSDWPLDEISDFAGCDVIGRLPRVRRARRVGPRSMNRPEWRPWWAAVRDVTAVLADVAVPGGRLLPDPQPQESAS